MKIKLVYLIILVSFLFIPVNAFALPESQDDAVLSVEFGIYDTVKSGRYLPVYIAVEKNGNFSLGFLRVIAPSYNGRQNIYEYSVSLKNRKKQKIVSYVPVCENTEKLYIELFDQEEKLVASQSVNVPIQGDYSEVFVGVLDRIENNESKLNHLVLDSYYTVSIKEFYISTDEFPENVLDLNMMDLLIVNPSAKENLTDSKRAVLQKWIEDGGICIYNDCGEDNQIAQGSGIVYGYETDLFNLDEEAMKEFLLKVLGQEFLGDIADNRIIEDYWKINDLVDIQDPKGIPFLYLYMLLLIIYMVIICPLIFILLKKKRKSIYYSYIVIFSAGLFSLAIFILGSKTRVYEPMVQYCKIVEIKQDLIYEKNYVSMESPDNKENELKINSDYTTLIIQDGYSDFNLNEEKKGYSQNYEFKVKEENGHHTLKIRNKKAFESSLFEMQKTEENSQGVSIDADLKLFDNRIEGKVTNLSGKDLEDVLIVGYCQYYYLGALKSGETVNVTGQSLSYYSSEYTKTVSSHCNDANEKAVSFLISECFEEPSNQFYVLGFSKGGEEFLSESDCDLSGSTLFYQECQMDFMRGDKQYYPVIPKKPEVISGTYRYKSAMMESQNCIISYDLSGLGLESGSMEVSFYQNDCSAVENIASYRKPFSGTCYFMNFETGVYEEVEDFGEHYVIYDLEPYLSGDMQIQVKYVDYSFGDGVYSIGIPFVSVIGRSLDAGY